MAGNVGDCQWLIRSGPDSTPQSHKEPRQSIIRAMLIFINGSINSGKTTTSRLVAKKIGADLIDFDEIRDTIPDFNLKKDVPKVLKLGIEAINQLTDLNKDVVANYVLRLKDYNVLIDGLKVREKHFFTLAPQLEVAQSNRGKLLNDWQVNRIKHHYDIGVANPNFGQIIDNSNMTLEETAVKIISIVTK